MINFRTNPPTYSTGPCRYSIDGKCCVRSHPAGEALCPPGICRPPSIDSAAWRRQASDHAALHSGPQPSEIGLLQQIEKLSRESTRTLQAILDRVGKDDAMTARQAPELYSPPDSDGPYYRRWCVWGICTSEGLLAEVTMDRDKANVWKVGGHKVIELEHREPIETAKAPTDGVQGRIL